MFITVLFHFRFVFIPVHGTLVLAVIGLSKILKIILPYQLIFLSLSLAPGVISLLNVTVRSEAKNDPGNGLASISVNNKNYAPQSKGYNVAVFDALSGRFILHIRL